jgi:hypothetical protein
LRLVQFFFFGSIRSFELLHRFSPITQFSTYGDYYFTPFGFILTLLGTLLAAMKTIITNLILIKPSSSENATLPLSIHSPSPPSLSPSADYKPLPVPSPHYRQTSSVPAPSSFSTTTTTTDHIFHSFSTLFNTVFPPSHSPTSSPAKPAPRFIISGPTTSTGFFTFPKLSLSPPAPVVFALAAGFYPNDALGALYGRA